MLLIDDIYTFQEISRKYSKKPELMTLQEKYIMNGLKTIVQKHLAIKQ